MKTISTVLNVGALSGRSVDDFYRICRRYNVEVLSCTKIGGFLVKKYHVTIRGNAQDIVLVSSAMSRF
jgi:hypothetical protein